MIAKLVSGIEDGEEPWVVASVERQENFILLNVPPLADSIQHFLVLYGKLGQAVNQISQRLFALGMKLMPDTLCVKKI